MMSFGHRWIKQLIIIINVLILTASRCIPRGGRKWFGSGCTLECHCVNNAQCVRLTGVCGFGCATGWSGKDCQTSETSHFENIQRENLSLTNELGSGLGGTNNLGVTKSSDYTDTWQPKVMSEWENSYDYEPGETIANTSADVRGLMTYDLHGFVIPLMATFGGVVVSVICFILMIVKLCQSLKHRKKKNDREKLRNCRLWNNMQNVRTWRPPPSQTISKIYDPASYNTYLGSLTRAQWFSGFALPVSEVNGKIQNNGSNWIMKTNEQCKDKKRQRPSNGVPYMIPVEFDTLSIGECGQSSSSYLYSPCVQETGDIHSNNQNKIMSDELHPGAKLFPTTPYRPQIQDHTRVASWMKRLPPQLADYPSSDFSGDNSTYMFCPIVTNARKCNSSDVPCSPDSNDGEIFYDSVFKNNTEIGDDTKVQRECSFANTGTPSMTRIPDLSKRRSTLNNDLKDLIIDYYANRDHNGRTKICQPLSSRDKNLADTSIALENKNYRQHHFVTAFRMNSFENFSCFNLENTDMSSTRL